MRNLIIDGGNLLYRTYHAALRADDQMLNSKGQNVTHVLYFIRKVKNLAKKYPSDKVFIAWDTRDKEFINFRQSSDAEYKEQRDESVSIEAHKNDKILLAMTQLLGIHNIQPSKLEADDIVAWLCLDHLKDADKNILISSDKDFLQLFALCPNLEMLSLIHI